ncbi:DUF1573 domain-containing protein [Tenacibaculum sp. ZS6-P6]|uniref:DUF1573 domain-containing protein n=1 Tax=Tenacibaculum sp. ZS6-P6 TaxID=3447503 RepID=UPI003F9796B4
MKTKITLVFVFLFGMLLHSQEFKFEKELINYGKVAQGSDGLRVFEFTNIGDAPLIIKHIKSTCGCTVPQKPEKPIMPGEKGKIAISYDTKRPGNFSKAITVFSNAKEERKMLKIKGFIATSEKAIQ